MYLAEENRNAIPECESCMDGLVPEHMEGQTIRVAEGLATMPKLFFDKNKRMLFSWLNQHIRSGRLQQTVGFPFTNRVINRNVCSFTTWEFRRIDRENFYTYVYVTLTLTTARGPRIWKGYLELWCSFHEALQCTVEDMRSREEMPDDTGVIRLSPFMVPYCRGYELDEACEEIWNRFFPETIANPKTRDAEKLAKRYGLSVQYLPVYDDQGAGSILFFAAGKLLVKEQKDWTINQPGMEEAKAEDDRRHPPEEVSIPANTIVVNTNKILKEYAAFSIFHECIHYEFHYLFFRLQEMFNNDIRGIKTKEITVTPGKKITDPLYWMEKQANRGAYGLMLPASWMRERIAAEAKTVQSYRHAGDLYDFIGRKICARYEIANFRMRARMIQLGFIEAKGALNWLPGGIRVDPFAFDAEQCRKVEETFIIGKDAAGRLYEENEDFRKVYDTGKFVYADGHIVRKDPRFVRETARGARLTPWANAHVDRCCLRFERIYIQSAPGRYIFGRMNFDTEYVAKTIFYLGDLADQEVFDETEEMKYKAEFPDSFREGLKKLMTQAGISFEEIAERMHISHSTFKRWLKDPETKVTTDFVMMISLVLELPDWISNLLMDRAGLCFGEKNSRDQALRFIQRAMWNDGIEKANEYLVKRGYKPLTIG